MQAASVAPIARILPFVRYQPEPLNTSASYIYDAQGQVMGTAIHRTWGEDMPACRLCRECTGDRDSGSCMIVMNIEVPLESCPLYDCYEARTLDAIH